MAEQPPPYNEKGQQPPPPASYNPSQPGYPPPQTGAYPQAQPGYSAQGTTVVVAAPPVFAVQIFREQPVRMKCPHCSSDIVTSITYETGTLTWVICGVLILFGLWLGCCLIPFCINGCKDCVHHCPNCRQMVGKYNRM